MWWNKFFGLKLESVVADPVKKDLTLYWWHWGYPTWVTGLSKVQLCFWPNPSLLYKSALPVCSARESTRLGGTRIQCNSATPKMVLLNTSMVWFNLENVPGWVQYGIGCNTMQYLSEVWLNSPAHNTLEQSFVKTYCSAFKCCGMV